jgi:hypothetical protein
MSPEQFVYWLQGFMEIANPATLDQKQVQVIKDHISLVLKKETPDRGAKTIAVPLVDRKTTQIDVAIFKPRCEGGTGNCFRLGCTVCSSHLPVTC